jgi:hypothetical protein
VNVGITKTKIVMDNKWCAFSLHLCRRVTNWFFAE